MNEDRLSMMFVADIEAPAPETVSLGNTRTFEI